MAAATFAASCANSNIINTPQGPRPEAVAPPPQPEPAQGLDPHLANAFDFHVNTDTVNGYYFTTPSGKWNCAIIPHSSAGCQSAAGALGITGAPATVHDGDGQDIAPNAVQIGNDGAPEFVRLPPPGFSPPASKPLTLTFGTTLAAAGFRCNVQESGVSCQSEFSRQGFTFSPESFVPEYTPVPG
jgi:hypothetical protein